MKRQKIVEGNWKMNKNLAEGQELAQQIADRLPDSEVELIICTPFIHLASVASFTAGKSNYHLGAQNCSEHASGAYTGETSVGMLASAGVEYVIVGHSERRSYYNEDNATLAAKTNAILAGGLLPIFCCGEPLEIREAGTHVDLVDTQLKEGLFHLSADEFKKVVIAYEPVWAIGTGVTASPEQAQEMHAAIRKMIADQYGDEIADATTILYGGSVKPNNAKELFGQPDVDGGLVGGASLKADDFIAIAESY